MQWRWIVILGIGVVAGVGATAALSNPSTRRALKAMLKKGLVAKDWLQKQLELTKEDWADLVAEAAHETASGAECESAAAASDANADA